MADITADVPTTDVPTTDVPTTDVPTDAGAVEPSTDVPSTDVHAGAVEPTVARTPRRRRAASRPAGPPPGTELASEAGGQHVPAPDAAQHPPAPEAVAPDTGGAPAAAQDADGVAGDGATAPRAKSTAGAVRRTRARKVAATSPAAGTEDVAAESAPTVDAAAVPAGTAPPGTDGNDASAAGAALVPADGATDGATDGAPARPARRSRARKTAAVPAFSAGTEPVADAPPPVLDTAVAAPDGTGTPTDAAQSAAAPDAVAAGVAGVLFQPPDPSAARPARRRSTRGAGAPAPVPAPSTTDAPVGQTGEQTAIPVANAVDGVETGQPHTADIAAADQRAPAARADDTDAEDTDTDADDTDAEDTGAEDTGAEDTGAEDEDTDAEEGRSDGYGEDDQSAPRRRRRRRGGRGRRRRPDEPEGPGERAEVDAAGTEVADRAAAATDRDGTAAGTDDPGTEVADPIGSEQIDEPVRAPRGGRRRRPAGATADASGERSAAETAAQAAVETEGEADRVAAEPGETADQVDGEQDESTADGDSAGGGTRRRRRRRRRGGDGAATPTGDDPPNTVVRVREPRQPAHRDQVTAVRGSTRIEAKKQRRREGREAGRRRPPILSESEFLARRESVERVMVIRQVADRTQLAALEDGMLVEHYVNQDAQQSLIGNVYLGRVQNVLPAMEAAFVDIGKGRNAILYAGEVDWAGLGLSGQAKRIESGLSPGQTVLVQVTKDPVGQKGARLTSQVSLPGRYVVYVPGGAMSGISRKLADTERARLKSVLKEVVPDEAGVIVRTAAEGASEDELTRDVSRLKAQWAGIEAKVKGGQVPQLLYGEPDLTVKVVRDVFNEDFARLVVAGEDAWATVEEYVTSVAPHLSSRVARWDDAAGDVFAAHRVDEQLAKALERKVFLPSGGSLVIDRTEAMTVVDVNTGKFTGSGGNLEETVTKNNLEAAEEIVRQLRLRDIGGIIVIDFIDMVLESNRDLVTRRLVECLGRDRTKHQVAEVTSLGLVQMTRKRIGTGLVEAFSTPCEHCQGRGIILSPLSPVPTSARRKPIPAGLIAATTHEHGDTSDGAASPVPSGNGADQPVAAPADV